VSDGIIIDEWARRYQEGSDSGLIVVLSRNFLEDMRDTTLILILHSRGPS
jgi:hypothetical protein